MPTYKNLLSGIRKPVVFQIRTGRKSAPSKMAGEIVGFCAFPRNNDLYQFMFQKRITVHIFKMPGKLPDILF
ncbi:hypothetical protein ESP47_03260 [Heyndrickxia coagulans]|jgi:hypothetical protein|uniref:Uncharacterized protein n=2 Tax=Heyndrickxia coagulans TaxID=1398 RepID=A0A0C5C4L3_HEYCO|nr:hypothetical protein [Heyndrickxia coagulans]AEP02476.1 hypothetical protein Bcoa_3304 [Heyndrickxia coagulans 36D1]KGT39724.1 hypothetical protein P421_03540 [Heyndrickxia coagulans P38]AJO23243.1 hypothetical protein SB48_HM08orf03888 [Heyndrickxia coagulans]AKN55254.1 hypothetical protein AB434_2849 [Heyndrickxia coagulans]APB35980.1 hypothetical protein BIZ35_03595 [Heyndrickxia coagulans]